MAMTASRAYGWMLIADMLQALLWIGTAVTLLLVCLNLWERRFSQAASGAAILLALAFTVISAKLLEISPNKIRFVITRHEYVSELPKTDDTSRMQFKRWPWNWYANGLILGGQTFELLIYDSSDQITLRSGTQTEEWLRNAKAAGYEIDHYDGHTWLEITNLGGHFYIVSGGW